MTYATLDPYLTGSSLMHRLDARPKVVVTLTYILTTALVPFGAWPVLVLLLALVVSAAVVAELPARRVATRVALAIPFALAAVPLAFTTPGTTLWRLPWGWTITAQGLSDAASIAAKSALSVQASVILTATTPMASMLVALRSLRVPRLIVSTLGLMWRYLFVLVDEARRLIRARAARSGADPAAQARPGGSLRWRAAVTGGMAGNLFLRGLERADRTYAAMCARGYDGEPRALPVPPLAPALRAATVAACVGLALLAAAGGLLWG